MIYLLITCFAYSIEIYAARKSLRSPEEVIDNTFTLVFAGLDTTASLLSSSFLKLSQDPELQKELRIKEDEG